jgi:glycosyltransferase involved in cell wall biosynthesis
MHALFREQLQAVPDGFKYAGDASTQPRAPTPRLAGAGLRARRLREMGERVAILSLAAAGFVRRSRVDPDPDARLIHSAQFLVRDSPLPYVVDFECAEVFVLYQRLALRRPWARRSLAMALKDPRLRRLLPWSSAAQRGLFAHLGAAAAEELGARTTIVLPAIRPAVSRPHERRRGPLRVLFIGTAFLQKGGVDAIRSVARCAQSKPLQLDVVSDVPARWAQEIEQSSFMRLHPWPASSEVVRGLFERCDVLLFPSHMDTLGYVVLEAMAHGMPVLASRHYACPELVEEGVSGLLFPAENTLYAEDGRCRFERTLPPPPNFRHALARPSEAYVDSIAQLLGRLAGDEALYARLAAGALERVRSGPLSMAHRRQILAQVYREALA